MTSNVVPIQAPTEAFVHDLFQVIQKHAGAVDLFTMIGVLEFAKQGLIEEEDEDDPTEHSA